MMKRTTVYWWILMAVIATDAFVPISPSQRLRPKQQLDKLSPPAPPFQNHPYSGQPFLLSPKVSSPRHPSKNRLVRRALVAWVGGLLTVLFCQASHAAATASPALIRAPNLLAAYSMLVVTAGIGLGVWSGVPFLATAILKASVRSTLQLCFVGLLLSKFFALSNVWLVVSWFLTTGLFAAQEASSRLEYSYHQLSNHLKLALLAGGGSVLGWACLWKVFGNTTPWFDPRLWIPITGMVFGNSLTTTSLAAQSLTTLLETQKDLIELKLSQGATLKEALREKLRKVYTTSLTPVLNFLSVAGIVHIPGMMAGQIVAGQKPLQAAAYQLLIFMLIASTSVLTVQLLVRLGVWELSDHTHDRLRPNVLYKIKSKSTNPQQKSIRGKVLSVFQFFNPLQNGRNEETAMPVNGAPSPYQKFVKTVRLKRPNLDKDKVVALSIDNMHVARTGIDLSMKLCFDERIALSGRSGIGKSQVLRTLAGLEEGQVDAKLFEVPASQMSMAEWRSHLVLVPQDRPALEGTPTDLYAEISHYATQKAKSTNVIAGHKRTPVEYAGEWGLPAAKFDQPWSTLSGGESQRALLAIALALQPDVLLLDESMNALDRPTMLEVENTLKSLRIPIVMVSHSNEQVERFCTHKIQLDTVSSLSTTSLSDAVTNY